MNARILPICILSIILCLVTTAARAQLTYEKVEVVDANYFVHTIQFAYDGEHIKFAVFHRHYGEPGLKCSVVYSVKNEKATPLSATITLNDTKQKDLLKEGGLYQVENGVTKQVALKFKTSELKEFLSECQRKPAAPIKEKAPPDHPAPSISTVNLTLDDFLAHLNRKNV
ncbi:MAG: hypothetical protein K0Q55_29 [Verrucomicrobia bacterium]|jgi:hypothetical protein|nr:hypothetical protein [Verrucomicrobiota bacterium]